MSSHDTQWPLYEVFVQEKAERPFQSVGAVHAADAEMERAVAFRRLDGGHVVDDRVCVCHSLVKGHGVSVIAAHVAERARHCVSADNSPRNRIESGQKFLDLKRQHECLASDR